MQIFTSTTTTSTQRITCHPTESTNYSYTRHLFAYPCVFARSRFSRFLRWFGRRLYTKRSVKIAMRCDTIRSKERRRRTHRGQGTGLADGQSAYLDDVRRQRFTVTEGEVAAEKDERGPSLDTLQRRRAAGWRPPVRQRAGHRLRVGVHHQIQPQRPHPHLGRVLQPSIRDRAVAAPPVPPKRRFISENVATCEGWARRHDATRHVTSRHPTPRHATPKLVNFRVIDACSYSYSYRSVRVACARVSVDEAEERLGPAYTASRC